MTRNKVAVGRSNSLGINEIVKTKNFFDDSLDGYSGPGDEEDEEEFDKELDLEELDFSDADSDINWYDDEDNEDLSVEVL